MRRTGLLGHLPRWTKPASERGRSPEAGGASDPAPRAAGGVAAARECGLLLTCGLYGNVIRPDADPADGLDMLEAALSVG
jgi:hypothetical protein